MNKTRLERAAEIESSPCSPIDIFCRLDPALFFLHLALPSWWQFYDFRCWYLNHVKVLTNLTYFARWHFPALYSSHRWPSFFPCALHTYFPALFSVHGNIRYFPALHLQPVWLFPALYSSHRWPSFFPCALHTYFPVPFYVHVNFRYFAALHLELAWLFSPALYSSHRWPSFFPCALRTYFPALFCVHVISDLDDLTEIRKLTANVEAVLLGVLIPLCQRNSGRLDEADREVLCHFKLFF